MSWSLEPCPDSPGVRADLRIAVRVLENPQLRDQRSRAAWLVALDEDRELLQSCAHAVVAAVAQALGQDLDVVGELLVLRDERVDGAGHGLATLGLADLREELLLGLAVGIANDARRRR